MQDLVITPIPGPFAAARIDRLDHWLLVIGEGMKARAWRALPYGELLRRRLRQRTTPPRSQPFVTDLPNGRGTRVVMVEMKSTAAALSTARLRTSGNVRARARPTTSSPRAF